MLIKDSKHTKNGPFTPNRARATVESKKSLKKIANFGKVKNAIFSKKMLKIES